MSGTNATIVVAIIGFFGIALQALLTNRQTKKATAATSALEERKVGLDEFKEVQGRNEAALERCNDEVERLDAKVDEVRDYYENKLSLAEARAEGYQNLMLASRRDTFILRAALADHGIEDPTAPNVVIDQPPPPDTL